MTAKEIINKYCTHQGYGEYSVDEDGLIASIEEYATQKSRESTNTSTNNPIVPCHVCGHPCIIGGDDEEGTHYYIPQ